MNYGVAYKAYLDSKSTALYEELDRSILSLSELMLEDNINKNLRDSYQIQLMQASSIRNDDIISYVSNKLAEAKITGVVVSVSFLDTDGGILVAIINPFIPSK